MAGCMDVSFVTRSYNLHYPYGWKHGGLSSTSLLIPNYCVTAHLSSGKALSDPSPDNLRGASIACTDPTLS